MKGKKLTPEKVAEIRRLAANRKKLLELAAYLGMDKMILTKIALLSKDEMAKLHSAAVVTPSYHEIARRFEVHPSTIAQIEQNKIWKTA